MTSMKPVATGFVDLGTTGATELRIHGVGGTPPADLLDHPHPVQVAGDATSGFYRRWDTDALLLEPGSRDRHVEGFCWGGLTSGTAKRALWVLLIPFLLVNVAHWALPGRAAQRRWANTASQRLIRLLALSLTMTLVLAAAETGVDLLARQCAATSCFKSAPSWLGGLAAHRALLLDLGAVIPVATLLVLGLLGRSTWKITERVDPSTDHGQPTRPDDPALADPLFWAGGEPVRRLWALHISAGLSTVAIIQVLPALDGPKRGLAVATLVLSGALLGATASLALGDGVARSHHRRPKETDLSRRAPWLVWAAGVAVAAALVVDLLPRALPPLSGAAHDVRRLDGLVQILFDGQTAVIVLLAAFVAVAGLRPEAAQGARRRRCDQFIAPALAILAWLTAWFFTAGVTIRVALQLFGTARGPVPATYLVWAALVAPAGGLILLGVGIGVLRWYRAEAFRQRRLLSVLPPPGGPIPGEVSPANTARTASLASMRTRAGLLDVAPPLVVAATAASVLCAIAGLVLALDSGPVLHRTWVLRLADLGTLLLGLGVLRLLAVARTAWKAGPKRPTFSILWDLGTFWPRAAHPLAPPCYCERALPQLHHRLTLVGRQPDDHVVIAGHSQGSVIAAALLLMPRGPSVAARVGLLTYGCPLGRLYGRAFPGYLGPQVLGVAQNGAAVGSRDAAV
ncbi:MAG: hypothetical protein QOK39_1977, partial [Acidimicrobiaceae bacterium]|nr:hypothetical protein [Acidimicrobiaceae bacterium]